MPTPQFPQPVEETAITLTRKEVELLLLTIETAGLHIDWNEKAEQSLDDISLKLNRAVFKSVFPRKED